MNWRSNKGGGYQWYLPVITSDKIGAGSNDEISAAIDAAREKENQS